MSHGFIPLLEKKPGCMKYHRLFNKYITILIIVYAQVTIGTHKSTFNFKLRKFLSKYLLVFVIYNIIKLIL